MRYIIALLVLHSFTACGDSGKDPFRTEVQAELTDILTKDLASTGKVTSPIQVDIIKIEKVSGKDYYNYERKEQEAQFKKYLEFIQKRNFAGSYEGQMRHDKVMSYLEQAIEQASEDPGIYKVDCRLKATTVTAQYDQRRTIFLDSNLRKVATDYSFLK